MKNLIIKSSLSTVLLGSLLLTSCGWKENPLQDKSQNTQQGQAPQEDKPLPGDIDQLLRISPSVDTFQFMEEQKRKYVINGSILVPGGEFRLSIQNLADFPEGDGQTAAFDPATGAFTWTPPLGFVDTVNDKQMKLKVLIVSTNLSTVRSRTAEIDVRITPSDKLPTIESISFPNNKGTMREGEVLTFDVVVKDITALDIAGGRPNLIFLPTKDGNVEAASFIEPADGVKVNPSLKDPKDPYTWVFHLQLDLRSREVTASATTLNWGMVAISNFKQQSDTVNAAIEVMTDLKKPLVTWIQPQTFRAGMLNSFTFTALDPRGEGKVEVIYPDCAAIHPNLVCGACQTSLGSGTEVLYCPISWNIPADYFTKGGKAEIKIPFKVTSKSKLWRDTYALPELSFVGTIKVQHTDDPTALIPSQAKPNELGAN